MLQPTDLFCHIIFFVKFNICTSLQILREHIPRHDFPVEQGHSVPIKYGETFFYLYLKLIVKRFQSLCHVQPDLEIFLKLTVQIGECIRKTPSAHCASGTGDFMQSLPSFVISCMVTCPLMP